MTKEVFVELQGVRFTYKTTDLKANDDLIDEAIEKFVKVMKKHFADFEFIDIVYTEVNTYNE